MSWLYLGLAIVLELAGSTCLKLSHGLTHLWPSIGLFGFYAVSFVLAALAMKVISLSTAYAIWSGVGTALTAVIGFAYFKEPMAALKLVAIGLIIVGVVMLQVAEKA